VHLEGNVLRVAEEVAFFLNAPALPLPDEAYIRNPTDAVASAGGNLG